MSKSILTVHKEIQKKEYAKSPLGQLEKKLGNFYVEMERSKEKLPEDISKQIYDIRDNNEKSVMAYIEESNKRDREAVDNLLFEAMSKEWKLIEDYQSNQISAMKKDD